MVGALDAQKLVGVVTSLLASIADVLGNLFFVVTLLAFLAFDSAHVGRLAEGARAHRPQLVDALSSFAHGTRTYLGVSAVFGLIVAVFDTALLWAMGVPGAFVWGVLAFVTNFIPNIGFVIGVIPPALVALLEGGPGLMLAVIVVYCLVNFVIQSVIQPRYVGGGRRPVDHADVHVPHLLDLGARPLGRADGRPHEPVLQGHPGRSRPRREVARPSDQRPPR